MKTTITFLTFLFCFCGFAQTVTEEMGSIESNFEFTSGSTKLDVVRQHLIPKNHLDARLSKLDTETYSYVVAMKEWHIEFVSNTLMPSRDRGSAEGRNRRGQYKLILKNKEGGELLNLYIGKDRVREWSGNTGNKAIYTYSINLYGMPLIILDNVAVVDIILIN